MSGPVDWNSRRNPHSGKTDTSPETTTNTAGRKVGEMDITQNPKQRQRLHTELIDLDLDIKTKDELLEK